MVFMVLKVSQVSNSRCLLEVFLLKAALWFFKELFPGHVCAWVCSIQYTSSIWRISGKNPQLKVPTTFDEMFLFNAAVTWISIYCIN